MAKKQEAPEAPEVPEVGKKSEETEVTFCSPCIFAGKEMMKGDKKIVTTQQAEHLRSLKLVK